MIGYYINVLKNYATFKGRARRMEFWMFNLCNFLVGILLGILSVFVPALAFLSFIYSLAIFIPSLAVTVRRLHDTNRGGGWIFIMFVPLIGSIWLLVLMFLDGTQGENRFGPNPKA